MDDTFTVSGSIGPVNGSIGYNTADHYWVGGAGVSVIPFQGAVNYSGGYGWSFGPDGTHSGFTQNVTISAPGMASAFGSDAYANAARNARSSDLGRFALDSTYLVGSSAGRPTSFTDALLRGQPLYSLNPAGALRLNSNPILTPTWSDTPIIGALRSNNPLEDRACFLQQPINYGNSIWTITDSPSVLTLPVPGTSWASTEYGPYYFDIPGGGVERATTAADQVIHDAAAAGVPPEVLAMMQEDLQNARANGVPDDDAAKGVRQIGLQAMSAGVGFDHSLTAAEWDAAMQAAYSRVEKQMSDANATGLGMAMGVTFALPGFTAGVGGMLAPQSIPAFLFSTVETAYWADHMYTAATLQPSHTAQFGTWVTGNKTAGQVIDVAVGIGLGLGRGLLYTSGGAAAKNRFIVTRSGETVDIGRGDVIRHFTNIGGASGITGVPQEVLARLQTGQRVVVQSATFKFTPGANSFLTGEGGGVGVTKLGADTTSGQLNRIGVLGDKQNFVIEFSQETQVMNNIKLRPDIPERSIWSLPDNTTVNGTITVQKIR